MVELGLNIRDEIKDEVKSFCSLNNVTWSDNVRESTTGGIIGEPKDITKVVDYINELEVSYNVKNKSWWCKLFG